MSAPSADVLLTCCVTFKGFFQRATISDASLLSCCKGLQSKANQEALYELRGAGGRKKRSFE